MSLSILLNTFANNILPIILLGGAGFALGKLLHVDPRSLGRVVFYIFSPVFIFDILLNNTLKLSEAAAVIGFTVIIILIMGFLAFLLGSSMKLERPALIAIIITTMFANTGNYGLPLVLFAFGKEAVSYASIYFITTTFMFYTVGVLIASLGHMNFKEATLGLLKLPTLWAVFLAILLNTFGIQLPVDACSAWRANDAGGAIHQYACPAIERGVETDCRSHHSPGVDRPPWHSGSCASGSRDAGCHADHGQYDRARIGISSGFKTHCGSGICQHIVESDHVDAFARVFGGMR
jgi:predicted permease